MEGGRGRWRDGGEDEGREWKMEGRKVRWREGEEKLIRFG